MKSETDLKQFYDSTLSGSLKDLEEKRRKIATKLIVFWVVLGFIFIFSLLASIVMLNPIIAIVLFIFLLIIGIITHIIFLNRGIKFFTSEFKVRIVGEVVKYIDENLVYAPENGISQQTYMDSQIEDLDLNIRIWK